MVFFRIEDRTSAPLRGSDPGISGGDATAAAGLPALNTL